MSIVIDKVVPGNIVDHTHTPEDHAHNTDDLTEGSSNLFFTDERVDDRVAALLVAGVGIDITYDDALNTITIDVVTSFLDTLYQPIGSYQTLDATLTALAGLVTAADQMIYATGADAFSMTELTAFARTLLDDADAAAARTTLGLVAGGAGDIWVEKAGDTMTGALMIDGSADAIQLLVQAHSTQTSALAVWETSAGTDIVRIEHTLTQSITSNFFSAEGTIPDATSATLAGTRIDITTQGSGTANSRIGLLARLLPGYTGVASAIALQANNTVAGTGSNFNSSGASQPVGNLGLNATASATTTGLNIAGFYAATGGNTNVAVFTKAILNKASAIAIGVYSIAKNVSVTAPVSIGGYFGLQLSDPTFESAALIAENGTVSCPIFIGRDNGTKVFGVEDGGYVSIIANLATDTAPDDDTTIKKLSVQKLAAPPTNAAYVAFANNPGTDIFYLVMEEA